MELNSINMQHPANSSAAMAGTVQQAGRVIGSTDGGKAEIAPPVSRGDVEDAAKRTEDFVRKLEAVKDNSLKFELDEDLGKTIVKVVDIQTDTVIRQIPSEEMVQIAKALDKLQGLLFKSQA